jgi:hypothetical protein
VAYEVGMTSSEVVEHSEPFVSERRELDRRWGVEGVGRRKRREVGEGLVDLHDTRVKRQQERGREERDGRKEAQRRRAKQER